MNAAVVLPLPELYIYYSIIHMRHFMVILLLLLCVNANAQQGSKTAIVHVNIVDVEEGVLIKDQTVLIANETIADIFPSSAKKTLSGWTMINAKGKYLIPGLIDSHVHLHNFYSISQPQVLQAALNVFLYYGVTGIREASGSIFTKEMIALRDSLASENKLGPKIYTSGIATSTTLKKFNALSYTDLVGKFKQMGVDGIKVKFTTFNETKEIIDAAHAVQLPVYGHTANAWKPDSTNIQGDFTEGIVDYGINGVMHSAGYVAVGHVKLPPPPPVDSIYSRWIYNENLWFYKDEAAEDLLIKKMITHHTWLEPTLTVEEIMPSREQYRNDPGLKFSLMTYKDYEDGWPALTARHKDSMLFAFKQKQAFVKKFYEAGGLVLAGTDHLYGSSLHKELELLAGAGLSPAMVLKIATYNNAQALGWLDQLGTIRKGKKANLVLLDRNPLENILNSRAINSVVLNGRILDRKKLDDLLKAALEIVTRYKDQN